jgi:hypothetical protein
MDIVRVLSQVSPCHSPSSAWRWWNSSSILSIIRWLTNDTSCHPDLGAQPQPDWCRLISHIHIVRSANKWQPGIFLWPSVLLIYAAVKFSPLADRVKSKNLTVLYLPIWIWWLRPTPPNYIKAVINGTSLSLDDAMAFPGGFSQHYCLLYVYVLAWWHLSVAVILPIPCEIWLSCILCRMCLRYCPLSTSITTYQN